MLQMLPQQQQLQVSFRMWRNELNGLTMIVSNCRNSNSNSNMQQLQLAPVGGEMNLTG